jgi:ABC-type multidrug transport system fused ATPase/permease subunit
MSGGAIIGFAITYIIYKINSQYNKINIYNTEILEQKEAINKISIICENLYISKILNHINNYNISYKYIIIIIIEIIILLLYIYFNIQLTLTLIIILIILILLIIILYFNHKYINKNKENINNKGIEIINKKDEINNYYYNKLLITLNDNDDINYINSNIDEYILNHLYLFNIYVKNCIKINNTYILIQSRINIKKDKKTLLNNLLNNLIINKKDYLIGNMNTKFKTFKEITPDIVKNELDETDNILDIYRKSLELKIKNINQLSRINDCIINIS